MLNDSLKSAEPTERARLDEVTYEKLSELATLLELLGAIRLHNPRFKYRAASDCARTKDRIY